jgi:hypothetical protein
MRRSTAKHGRRPDTTPNGQVRTRAARPQSESQSLARPHAKGYADGHGSPVERHGKVCACDSHDPVVFELELRTDERNLEGRFVCVIPDERVRDAV